MTLPDISRKGQALSSNHADEKSPEALTGHLEPADQTHPADVTSPFASLVAQVKVSARDAWRRVQQFTASLGIQTDAASSSNRLSQLLPVAGGAVAGIWLLTLGWHNHQLKQSLATQEQQIAQANAIINHLEQQHAVISTALTNLHNPTSAYALQGVGDLANAAGSVITIAGQEKAFLVTPDLPSLPENQVYRFWATTDTQNRLMYCGQFTIDQSAFVEWSLPMPACARQATQVLITIDPITASIASAGEVVLRSQSIPFAE